MELEQIAEREYLAYLAKYPKLAAKIDIDISRMIFWFGFAKGQELLLQEVKRVMHG